MPQGKANRTRRSYNDLFVMGTWAASITAFTVFHETEAAPVAATWIL
jgi:hypothetical protein